jgi:hypothetical protein
MSILAETILERDKEQGRKRSQRATLRTIDAVVAQNRPAHKYRIGGEARLLAVCGVASPRRSTMTTSSSSRLASGLNSGFQYAHYLLMAQ